MLFTSSNLRASQSSISLSHIISRRYSQIPIPKPSLWKRIKQQANVYVDAEQNLKERRELLKESYWNEFVDLKKHGGKMSEAQNRLIPVANAVELPAIPGRTLAKTKTNIRDVVLKKKAVTLLSICFVRFGEEHIESFVSPFLKEFQSDPKFQHCHINAQENWMKVVILWCCLPSIRKQIPEIQRERYLVSFGDIEQPRRTLGITNSYLGYVYLIDDQGRVRWGAHGNSTTAERQSMLSMAKQLKKELEKEDK